MLYVLCEDKGMGFQFWNAINKVLWENKAIVRHCEDGNSAMSRKLLSMSLNTTDTLFAAFDRAAGRETKKFMEFLYLHQKQYKYRVFFPCFYCLEELFLSFSEISVWGQCEDSDALRIEAMITKSSLYLPETNPDAKDFLPDCRESGYYNSAFKQFITPLKMSQGGQPYIVPKQDIIDGVVVATTNTRENFAKKLLSELTAGGNRRFHIPIKGDLKDCWHRDCEEVRTDIGTLNACDICPLKNRIEKGFEKLQFFGDNSLGSNR